LQGQVERLMQRWSGRRAFGVQNGSRTGDEGNVKVTALPNGKTERGLADQKPHANVETGAAQIAMKLYRICMYHR
jgi:hypothetical protein